MKPTYIPWLLISILSGPTCSPIDFQAGPLPPIPDGGSDDSTDSQIDPIEDSGTDTDGDSDTDSDSETETGSDTETDLDAGMDAGTDTDSDTDVDSDTDTDVDSDTDSDTSSPCSGEGVWLDEGASFDYDSDSEPEGSWPGTRCWQDPPAPDLMEWYDAVAYCAALELAGYDDWVLPNINELRYLGRGNTYECNDCGLIDPGHLYESDIGDCEACTPAFGGPGVGGCYWPAELSGGCGIDPYHYWYWSSSGMSGYPLNHVWAWSFAMNYPGEASFSKDLLESVRCVRPL